ncbi:MULTISPECIES: toxin-antitoxin system, toxin component [Streptomyces]|uniref:Toxin-antitoxin system, toxin component n=1 Tax=Streptomyces camelliae TaxID=3004093 RepID=A0ABY7PFH7_9ACTN|nr:toxin-antitoxin system, toxin component [Streptomyces sp. HUAS 2-6]WBO69142.1 toxin-antitoxin system, toxin component [Streptomyces sp. HUAS 2-6]
MRRLCGELVGGLTLPVPAPEQELYRALCEAMSRRRGRPVHFRTAVFPPGTASGLWLDLTDRDIVVVEERTAPGHQLVILGHELWHMQADHRGHRTDGVGVATRLLDDDDTDQAALEAAVRRVAARTRFDLAEERQAETFGLLLASKCRTWLAGSALRGAGRRDDVAGRIEASLGYPGPQG